MRSIVVASQMTGEFNRALQAAVSNVDIVPLAPGNLSVPPEVEVLIVAPFHRAGDDLSYAPPAGWPFSIRWIQLLSAGADLYPAWLFNGPPVISARGATALALSEFAVAAIFAAAKCLPDVWIHTPDNWKPASLFQVSGATLGLVGFGAIGKVLAPKALALGMKVLAVRKTSAPLLQGVERAANLADLFARSDHVVLICAATPETNGLVGESLLAQARPGLHLVNLSRGSLIDDAALVAALDAGRLRLATLDCAHPEPLPAGHAFYTHERVRLSPHISAYAPDVQPRLVEKFARNLERYRAGQSLEDSVDPATRY